LTATAEVVAMTAKLIELGANRDLDERERRQQISTELRELTAELEAQKLGAMLAERVA
jgi:hypothetical protein